MRVVAISCVKNELDIVEPFVRHTLAHADHLIVLDNGSSDGTRQILQSLADERLPISVKDDPTLGNYQSRRMTALMREAVSQSGADWVLPVDVDEFYCGCNLKQLLAAATNDAMLALCWRTYVPDPCDDSGEPNPVRRIVHRLKEESHPVLKVIVPAVVAGAANAVLDQGSHQIIQNGACPTPRILPDSVLAHFPGRSSEQFARKVIEKHLQYLAMEDRVPGWGFHYDAPWQRLVQGWDAFVDAFRQTMLRYNLPEDLALAPETIRDPIDYRGGAPRHTPRASEPSVLLSLMRSAETLATQHAGLAKGQRLLEQSLAESEGRARTMQCNLERALAETHTRAQALQHDLECELAEAQARNQAAQRASELARAENQIAQQEIERLRQSWSFRVGALMLQPLRWLKHRLAS